MVMFGKIVSQVDRIRSSGESILSYSAAFQGQGKWCLLGRSDGGVKLENDRGEFSPFPLHNFRILL